MWPERNRSAHFYMSAIFAKISLLDPSKSQKTCQKWSQNLEKSRFGGGLGALGGDLETKNLSKAVLADFGQFWPRSDRPESCPHGLRWEPRWHRDVPSWGQDGHLGAIWGGILSIFGGLGSDI